MADLSRRGVFALLAGAAAAPYVGRGWTVTISLADVVTAARAPGKTGLAAVTRKAFIPKVYARTYESHPILSLRGHGD